MIFDWQTDGRTDRWTDRQASVGKTMSPTMEGRHNNVKQGYSELLEQPCSVCQSQLVTAPLLL